MEAIPLSNAPVRSTVVLAMVTLALLPLPAASASDCIEVDTTTFAEHMHVIANAGREIALGFRSDEPGEGAGFVVIITPAVCTGVGAGELGLEGVLPADPTDAVPAIPVPSNPLLP